jgi:hypothetical protein
MATLMAMALVNKKEGTMQFEDKRLQQIWDSLGDDEFATTGTIRKKRKPVDAKLSETVRLRLEIRRMIQNSQWVVQEETKNIKQLTKEEKYFCANQSKIAVMIHSNLIVRLTRVLEGKSAFDHEIPLDEDDDIDVDDAPTLFIK